MKAIFLDIDGVLNTHQALSNGYCGIEAKPVKHLNYILDQVPDAQIVISSAWRYQVHNGDMTVKGFENLLLSHGIHCYRRLQGITEPDECDIAEEEHKPPYDRQVWSERGLLWRSRQIERYVLKWGVKRYVVLDDLPLTIPNLVCTAEYVAGGSLLVAKCNGLEEWHAKKAVRILSCDTEASA